ncbi:glycosyltransferase family 2 protein [Gaoshiqia sediminis]|uniref:Glycosyltransferase n=1 Tax=Gaoshiqia sediminis TaxID=2986998 RepID=A0AA41Y638_9BACT|nr:glycosyltransferase family 2 protein [Gaoshiqia sediminis]MCW0484116.1 glycosyltransferase [Gaoshiqia sediminis]
MTDISIIIATYNAEKYLQRCLDSIKANKSENIELIIIDGKSNDRTLDILNENRHDIDFWISENDKGIYDAWNKGIKVAKGKWIMFLGADDQLKVNALQNYLTFLKNNNVSYIDYICALNEYIDKNGKLVATIGDKCVWPKMRKYMSAAHVGSLHNKKLFKEVGDYDLQFRICADYELLVRKRDSLKSIFIPIKIAKMETGGMSFSYAAVRELYKIRKYHSTLTPLENQFYFIRNVTTFYLLKLKLLLTN